MKDAWLTLLIQIPALNELSQKLKEFGFGQVKVESDKEVSISATCVLCERRLVANLYKLNRDKDSSGLKIVDSCLKVVTEAGGVSGCEIVLDHLQNTHAVILSRSATNNSCDCDFRFHQAMAIGEFLWYVDGRGFADDVETYLETF